MTPFLGNHSTAKSGTTVTFGLSLCDRKSSHLGPPGSLRFETDGAEAQFWPLLIQPNLGLAVATIL